MIALLRAGAPTSPWCRAQISPVATTATRETLPPPNLASRYQRVRSSAEPEPNPTLRIDGSDDPASASLMKPRREGEQALTRAEMLSRHPLAQNRLGSLKSHCTCATRPFGLVP